MKKLFSLISLLGIGTTPLAAVVSCNKSSSDSKNISLQFVNGVKDINISGDTYSVTIDNWEDFLDCEFKIETSGSQFDPSNNENTNVPFTADVPDEDGNITFKQNGIGKGKVTITAIRNGDTAGQITADVTSSPAFNFDKIGNIQFNADKNGDFPKNTDDKWKDAEFSLTNFESMSKLYDITFDAVKKYDDGQSPFGQDYKNEKITDSSLIKTTDKGGATFDLSKIKQSGASSFSTKAIIKSDFKEAIDNYFATVSFEEIKSNPINVIAIGHGEQSFGDDVDAKISSDDSGTTGAMGNFNNVALYNTSKKYSANIKSDNSIGAKATVAMLVPTAFFTGQKTTNIGVSASKLTLKDSSSVNVSVFYKGKYTVSASGEAKFDQLSNDTLSISTGASGGEITITGEGGLSQVITVSSDNSITDNKFEAPIAPLVDLSAASSKISTSTVTGYDTWDLTKATYVKLDVLSSLMNNQSEFYAFYAQVDVGTDFNFDINSTSADYGSKFLTAVLSGAFDMTKLLITQGGGSSSSANTYQQFIDSIANLYFTTYSKK